MENNLASLFGFDGDEYTLDRAYFSSSKDPILTVHIKENGATHQRTHRGTEAFLLLKILEQNKFPVTKR